MADFSYFLKVLRACHGLWENEKGPVRAGPFCIGFVAW
jgi:hypothetical protein